MFAYGLGAGVDAYVSPTGHRVGAYIDLTRSPPKDDGFSGRVSEHYVAVGVAYRFW